MADITLKNGRELTLDLYAVSMREYRALLDREQPAEEGDAILGKAFGLTAAEVSDLPQPEWRRLVAAFFKAAREPLADPNSASASS